MHRLVVVACVLAVVACGGGSASVAPNAIADGAVALVDNVSSTAWPSDPLSVESASITGDALQATVRFGGGCARHRIALLLGRAFMESFPVQVHARLTHDSGGDMCDALLTRTITFDLTPLKQRYLSAYGPGAATVVINLSGVPGSLRYSF